MHIEATKRGVKKQHEQTATSVTMFITRESGVSLEERFVLVTNVKSQLTQKGNQSIAMTWRPKYVSYDLGLHISTIIVMGCPLLT